MHKTIVLAISVSFLGGMVHAFNPDEWTPIGSVEEQAPTAGSMAERQMREVMRKHLTSIESMPLRALRVIAYLRVLSSLCDDTQMQPLERLLWANIAREEIEGRLVAETGMSVNELNKALPRGADEPDGGTELRATARAALLVQEASMDSLDGMVEAGDRIYEYMQRSLPDLLTVGAVSVPSGFDMAAHSEMVEEMLSGYMEKANTRIGNAEKRRKREVIGLACGLGVTGVLLTVASFYIGRKIMGEKKEK